MPAEQWLAPVAYSLQYQINNTDSIGNTGIGSDRRLSAIRHGETVYDDQRDIRGHRKPKRGNPDFQYRHRYLSKFGKRNAQRKLLFAQQPDKSNQHGNTLPDDRSPCRTRNSLLQYPYEQVIQNDIGDKARNHRNHCVKGTAVVTDERH